MDTQLISLFYQPLTTCHLDFVVKILGKCCVSSPTFTMFKFIEKKKKMFQIFAHSLKKKKQKISKTLAYLGFDNGMKLSIPALFFFIHKIKITPPVQPIDLYLHPWLFSHSLYFSPFYVFLVFSLSNQAAW